MLCVLMFCLHACLCPASSCGACGGSRKPSEPLKLVLQMVVSHIVSAARAVSPALRMLFKKSLCLQFYFADSVIFRNIPKNPFDRKSKIHILVPWWAVLALDEQYIRLVTSCLRWSGSPLLGRAWAQRLAEGVIPFSATSLLRVQNLSFPVRMALPQDAGAQWRGCGKRSRASPGEIS